MKHCKLNFARIDQEALRYSLAILQRWLPNGRIDRQEYIALNPTRHDRKLGSFRINVTNGLWSDFATGDKGKGFISLGVYLSGNSAHDVAEMMARMLGIEEKCYE